MRTYTLTLLGGVSLRTGAVTLTGPAVQRHRLALLALLAAQPTRAVPRERLTALLWPERDAESARRLLNLSVHVLRRALGDTALRSVPGGLALDPSALACDVWTFEQALADGDTELAIASYGGPFLEGFHLPDTVDFDGWADAERDRAAGLAFLKQVGDESGGETYVPAYEMAKLTLGLGDRPATHRWLRRARRQRSHSIAFLGVDPELAELR